LECPLDEVEVLVGVLEEPAVFFVGFPAVPDEPWLDPEDEPWDPPLPPRLLVPVEAPWFVPGLPLLTRPGAVALLPLPGLLLP
jgi:hypothetical protein